MRAMQRVTWATIESTLIVSLLAVVSYSPAKSAVRVAAPVTTTTASTTTTTTTTTLPPTTTTVPPTTEPPTTAPPTTAAAAAATYTGKWTLDPYVGLGAWIDVYDWSET